MEDDQTWSFRGSKSRNKVSVGEPAEGSLLFFGNTTAQTNSNQKSGRTASRFGWLALRGRPAVSQHCVTLGVPVLRGRRAFLIRYKGWRRLGRGSFSSRSFLALAGKKPYERGCGEGLKSSAVRTVVAAPSVSFFSLPLRIFFIEWSTIFSIGSRFCQHAFARWEPVL